MHQVSWLRLQCVQIGPKTYSKTPKLTELFLLWSIINEPDWDGRPKVVPSTKSSSDCFLVYQLSWLRLECVQIGQKTYSKTPKLTQLFLIMVNY